MRHGNGHDQPSYIMAALLLAGKNQSPRTLALPMPLLIAPETVAGPMILAIGNSFCSSSSAVALGPAAIACQAFTALFVGRLSNCLGRKHPLAAWWNRGPIGSGAGR